MKRFISLAVLLLLSTSCSLIPQKHPRYSHRASCRQALEQGWCYDDCKVKPIHCCVPKNVRCNSDGMCSWEGCDGSIVFGTW